MNLKRLVGWLGMFGLLLLTAPVYAQKIAVNKQSLRTDSTMSAECSRLAKSLLGSYHQKDSLSYYDQLFRLHLLAGNYRTGVQFLREFRNMQPDKNWDGLPVIGIQFELYGFTEEKLSEGRTDTISLIEEQLQRLIEAVPATSVSYAQQYFQPDIENLIKRKDELVSAIIAQKGDDVEVKDALQLCRFVLALKIASAVNSTALNYFRKQEEKKYVIEDSLYLTGADGALLSGVVVRKKDADVPLPVILVFSIYPSAGDIGIAKRAADHGYVGVVVYTRGKYLSQAEIQPFEHDAKDCFATISWLVKQPWCDGRVGMYGGSYLGFTQWSVQKYPHPALKTIVPQAAVAPGVDFPNYGGVYGSYMLCWLHLVTNNRNMDYLSFNNTEKWSALYRKWFNSSLPFYLLDSLEGNPHPQFQKWLMHPAYDSYWQSLMPYKSDFAKINLPVLTITGFYDDDQYGAMYYFNEHHRYHKQPQHYFLMGPWDHAGAQSSPALEVRGYAIDSIAYCDIDSMVFEWMDYIFKKKDRPAILRDKINVQLMGSNQWINSSTFSSLSNDTIRFYLNPTKKRKEYTLSDKLVPDKTVLLKKNLRSEDESSFVELENDLNILNAGNPCRAGVNYSTAVLNDTINIAGAFQLTLTILPEVRDADFIVRLYEVTADGHYFLISSAIQRGSYLNGSILKKTWSPGEEQTLEITTAAFSAKQVLPGNRLVVNLDIYKNYASEINYGSGKRVCNETPADYSGSTSIKVLGNSVIEIPVHVK